MPEQEESRYLDITVFILSYNRPEYLREMLLSVLAQTCQPEEIIILDNGSTNGTKEAVEDLLGPRVKFVGADSNHHSLWNFRRAMSMSERKFLTVIHDDDRLVPKFLEVTVGLLSSDDGLVAVTTNGYRINDDGERTHRNLLSDPPGGVILFKDEREVAFRTSNNFVPFPNLVYRNGYPQKVKTRMEFGKILDCIFIIDLARLGKIAIANDLLYEYRIHGQQDSALMPEDLLQMKEDFILNLFEGRENYPDVEMNIQKYQTGRFLDNLITSIVRRRDPRVFFRTYRGSANKYVTLRYIPYSLLSDMLKYYKEKEHSL